MSILNLKHLSMHIPTDPHKWQGRRDGFNTKRLHELIHFWKNEPLEYNEKSHRIAFVGFCSDEGILRNQGRIGAASGPQALRKALSNLPLFNAKNTFFDIGDILCSQGNLEQAQTELGELVETLLKHHFFPIVLGGGHEMAWGHYLGIASVFPKNPLSIINFDAHLDMRPLLEGKGSSGTSFLQIAHDRKQKKLPFDYTCLGLQAFGNTKELLETAKTYEVNIVQARDFHLNLSIPLKTVKEICARAESIYLTICLDVFAQAYSPGVSAPQPLGLTPWQMIPLLIELRESGKLIGVDIAELSPPFDRDDMTAKLAAQLIACFI